MIVGEAVGGRAETHSWNERRGGAASEIGTDLRGAEVQAGVFTRDHVEGAAGRDLDEWSESEIAAEAMHKGIAGLVRRGLVNAAGDPAMALIVYGIAAFVIGETAIGGFERGLQVSAIINRMRPGVTGEQLEMLGELLG